MPLRLGLLTTLDHNIGDDFIREGLLHCIRQIADGRKVECAMVHKHTPLTIYKKWHPLRLLHQRNGRPRRKTKFWRRLCERHLPPLGLTRFERCDAIIQCGTPTIWEGCRLSEWAGPIWRDVFARLARRGVPVLNLGGGSCYPHERHPETLRGNADEAFIRLMLDSSRVTTVRDRLSQKLFASLGHETRQIGCPALLAGQAHASPARPTRKVLVNYMAGGGHYEWGQGIDASLWEQTMRQTVGHLRAQGWEPLLLAHDRPELALAARLWPDLPRICPRGMREYFETVRDAAFGIFNRMHASIAAAGLGIPSVAIGTDSRNLMVEATGLPVLYVKEATFERLRSIIDYFQYDRETESHRLLALRETVRKEYADCLRQALPWKSPAARQGEKAALRPSEAHMA
jgi:polysaccharide pyruvyl transferase WcaK-like protein